MMQDVAYFTIAKQEDNLTVKIPKANSENSRPLLRRGKKSEIFYNKKPRFKMRGF